MVSEMWTILNFKAVREDEAQPMWDIDLRLDDPDFEKARAEINALVNDGVGSLVRISRSDNRSPFLRAP